MATGGRGAGVKGPARNAFGVFGQFLLFMLVVGILYTLVSVGVAVSTADKCGSNRLDNAKEWQYVPPHWECVAP